MHAQILPLSSLSANTHFFFCLRLCLLLNMHPRALQQEIILVDKRQDGTVTEKPLFGVRYVPLTDADSQLGRGPGRTEI